MDALHQLAQWPADDVAAAVIAPERSLNVAFGDTSRVFPLASVTKLLVAQAVLVAVEEGAVELDTPAGPPGSTVAHLLAHASGLGPSTNSGGGSGSGRWTGRGGEPSEVQAEPGTRRIYSSAGYEILAETVQEATGIPFRDYLDEAVVQPLGMTATSLDGSAGYAASSNVDDLVRFAGELLVPQLISPQTATAARTVAFPGLDGFVPGYGKFRPNDWGLGPELKGAKNPHWTAHAHSPGTFGHFGQSGTFLWVDPARRAAAVVLTDRAFGPWAKPLWSDFNQAVLAELDGRPG